MLIGCCNGPGLVGAYYGFIDGFLCNLEDDGCTAPCWCIGDTTLAAVGYDSDRDWLLCTVADFGHFSTGIPEIVYLDLRACDEVDGLPAPTVLLDNTAAAAIFAGDALPTTSYTNYTQTWVGIFKRSIDDDYRIYGTTQWNNGDDTFYYVRVWSVSYGGSDFTEHLNYHTAGVTSLPATPVNLTSDGDIVTQSFDSGPIALNILVNGTTALTVDQTSNISFNIADGVSVGATVGGSVVALNSTFGLLAGNDPDSDYVYLAYIKDGYTYQFGAIGAGWSDKFGGLMVLWVGGPIDGGPAPASPMLVTLATAALSPGNILGQDGVTAYDFSVAPGVKWSLLQTWFTFINFCTLPRPTDFDPATITPTPPTCDDIYGGCDFSSHPLQIVVSFGEDCTIPPGDNPWTEYRYGSVINGSWTLANALTFDSSQVLCVSYDKNGWAILIVDYTAAPFDGGTLDDQYAALTSAGPDLAGYLYRKQETPGSDKQEFWLVELAAKVSCEDGLIYYAEFHVITIEANFHWDTDHWVLDTIFSPQCKTSYTTIIHKYPGLLFPDCSTVLPADPPAITGMVTLFENDVCGTDSPDGLEVTAYIDSVP